MKQETSYFLHFSNSRHSTKMLKLRFKHKLAGYGLYYWIMERLRDEEDYVHTRDYDIIGADAGVDSGLVKSVVEDFGLFAFTDDGKYFYSEELCEQMNERKKILEIKREIGRRGGRPKKPNENQKVSEIEPEVSETKPSINQVSQSVNQSSQSNQSVNQSKPSKRFAPPRATQEEVFERLNYFARLKDGKERNALDMILVMGGEIPVPDPSEQMAIVNLDNGGRIGGIFWTAVREWRTKPDLRKAIDHPNYWLLSKYKHLDSYKKLFGIQKEETEEAEAPSS